MHGQNQSGAPDHVPADVVKRLQQTPATRTRIRRQDFDLFNATAGQNSKIAEYTAEMPLVIEEGRPARLMFVTVEEFQTDATASNTETFNLSNNLVQTPNTENFLLYENGSQVSADAVNYSGDSFDYTDDGTGNYLHAVYVFRDPIPVEVRKAAPSAAGGQHETLLEDVTSSLAEGNQNKEPPTFDLPHSPLQGVIPRNWRIEVYADGSPAIEWDDSSETNSQGVTAISPILDVPVKQAGQKVKGLSNAVKRDMAMR